MEQQEDKLERRNMDELFQLSRLGEIVAIASLQFTEEPSKVSKDEIKYEEFPEEPEEEKKPEGEGEGEGDDPPPEEGEGDDKPPPFDPKEFQWTVTNKKQRNLPQMFVHLKGDDSLDQVKSAEDYSNTQYDAIAQGLDSFMERVCIGDLKTEGQKGFLQLIFTEH